MNKFGNIVNSARHRLGMQPFIFVSDVVSLNSNAPFNSYCKAIIPYSQEKWDIGRDDILAAYLLVAQYNYRTDKLEDIYRQHKIASPGGMDIIAASTDLAMVKRKHTTFPETIRRLGGPYVATDGGIAIDGRNVERWGYPIIYHKEEVSIETSIGMITEYMIYELDDGIVIVFSTMIGGGLFITFDTYYVFNKEHLSKEQRDLSPCYSALTKSFY